MKNKFLALGAAVLLFASCSSDDSDGGSVDQTLLTKKWYYVSYTIGGETYPYDDHEECGKDYIEFKQQGIFNSVDVLDCVEESVPGTWAASGKKITVTLAGQKISGSVYELSAQTLKMKTKQDFDGDGKKETVIETYSSVQ